MTKPGALSSSFARIFLRSLSKINRGVRPSSPLDVNKRRLEQHRSIRIAAYASMASAVGTRRAWSRSLLRRIRCGGGGKISRWSLLEFSAWRRSNKAQGNRKKLKDGRRKRHDNDGSVQSARKKLRRLVPGGEAMEFLLLLDETTHYIKCLRTQVDVMRSIADYYAQT